MSLSSCVNAYHQAIERLRRLILPFRPGCEFRRISDYAVDTYVEKSPRTVEDHVRLLQQISHHRNEYHRLQTVPEDRRHLIARLLFDDLYADGARILSEIVPVEKKKNKKSSYKKETNGKVQPKSPSVPVNSFALLSIETPEPEPEQLAQEDFSDDDLFIEDTVHAVPVETEEEILLRAGLWVDTERTEMKEKIISMRGRLMDAGKLLAVPGMLYFQNDLYRQWPASSAEAEIVFPFFNASYACLASQKLLIELANLRIIFELLDWTRLDNEELLLLYRLMHDFERFFRLSREVLDSFFRRVEKTKWIQARPSCMLHIFKAIDMPGKSVPGFRQMLEAEGCGVCSILRYFHLSLSDAPVPLSCTEVHYDRDAPLRSAPMHEHGLRFLRAERLLEHRIISVAGVLRRTMGPDVRFPLNPIFLKGFHDIRLPSPNFRTLK